MNVPRPSVCPHQHGVLPHGFSLRGIPCLCGEDHPEYRIGGLFKPWFGRTYTHLVGGFNLWKIWKSFRIIIPNKGKNKTCSKPPTRHICDHIQWGCSIQTGAGNTHVRMIHEEHDIRTVLCHCTRVEEPAFTTQKLKRKQLWTFKASPPNVHEHYTFW